MVGSCLMVWLNVQNPLKNAWDGREFSFQNQVPKENSRPSQAWILSAFPP